MRLLTQLLKKTTTPVEPEPVTKTGLDTLLDRLQAYRFEHRIERDGYFTATWTDYVPTTLDKADIVSSRHREKDVDGHECHAILLDLDYPVVLDVDYPYTNVQQPTYGTVVRLSPPKAVRHRHIRALKRQLTDSGLAEHITIRDPLDELDRRRGPSKGTITLQISADTYLVESSTNGHHHLYVDIPGGVKKYPYRQFRKALGRAGLLEDIHAKAQSSELRPPGVKKNQR